MSLKRTGVSRMHRRPLKKRLVWSYDYERSIAICQFFGKPDCGVAVNCILGSIEKGNVNAVITSIEERIEREIAGTTTESRDEYFNRLRNTLLRRGSTEG